MEDDLGNATVKLTVYLKTRKSKDFQLSVESFYPSLQVIETCIPGDRSRGGMIFRGVGKVAVVCLIFLALAIAHVSLFASLG